MVRREGKRAHIVCGSPDLWLPRTLEGYIIGVDRGALKLIEKGIEMDCAIGDFDSVSKEEYQLIEEKVSLVIRLQPEKDVTDCAAALAYAVDQGCDDACLYGVIGGRFDHQFAAIGLSLKYAMRHFTVYLIDEKNKIFVLPPDLNEVERNDKKYISFFALERTVKQLRLEDVKYPLDNYELAADDMLCVSNEMLTSKMRLRFETGYLLVVQSSD
ncbi:MAG: thiamine diphosphokinase [Defluviitaleaceae bacterium]|nr:thiamine diphosphokinase [Defluviitaleaceae bacterium]